MTISGVALIEPDGQVKISKDKVVSLVRNKKVSFLFYLKIFYTYIF